MGVPEVSVLLVGYKTLAELTTSIGSLRDGGLEGVDAEIVLIDNASGDGTADAIAVAFPEVSVTALGENIGFGRAVNLAARQSVGEYLLLLNPDTIVRPGAVRALLEFAKAHPHAGLVGGRTLTAEGHTEPSSCWGAPSLWSTFCFGSGLSTVFAGSRRFDPEALGGWDRDTIAEVGVVTGCLVMVARATWQQLGGFDERFFMYGEDTDLSLRAREAGFRPMITPAAEVVHTIGASSSVPGARRVMIMRGKATVLRLHWPRRQARLGVALLVVGVGLRAMLSAIKRRTGRTLSPEQQSWLGAWQHRSDWVDGYPPYTPIEVPRVSVGAR